MKVLIVEDSRTFALKIEKAIESWGYEAESAGTGRHAILKLREDTFDIILLDIFLPDGKGIEFIPEFREFCPDLEIITMTAFSSRELEMETRHYGILYYMLKPFDLGQLREILDHVSKKFMALSSKKKEEKTHGRISKQNGSGR